MIANVKEINSNNYNNIDNNNKNNNNNNSSSNNDNNNNNNNNNSNNNNNNNSNNNDNSNNNNNNNSKGDTMSKLHKLRIHKYIYMSKISEYYNRFFPFALRCIFTFPCLVICWNLRNLFGIWLRAIGFN